MRTAGACAYLTKGGASENLIETIRSCARGQAALAAG
jgi:DNA-binding NarL/FixJ family response regulator